MPRPRCALPITSPALSSSGIVISHDRRFTQTGQRGFDDTLRIRRHLANGYCLGLTFDRCHRHIRDSTRRYLIERGEIAAHIEREAMHRDPMAHADTDR